MKLYFLYVFLLLPFFKPDSINIFSDKIDLIFNICKVISVIIALMMIAIKIMKSKKITKGMLFLVIIHIWLIIITILRHGDIKLVTLYSLSIIGIGIITEHGMKNKKVFIKALMFCFEVAIYLNLLSIIFFPNGMYTTGTQYTGVATVNWFLGFKNVQVCYFLPAFIVSYINMIVNNRSKRSVCLIIAIVISSIWINSSTTLIGILLLSLILFVPKVKNNTKIFNFKNYMLIILFAFLFIVIFRLQEYLEFLIVDILHKDLNFTNRTRLWDITIKEILNHPFLGNGWMQEWVRHKLYKSQTVLHSHNMILELLYLGGIVYAIIYVYILKNVNLKIKEYYSEEIIQTLSAGFFIFHILGLAEFYIHPIIYIILILMIYSPSWVETEKKNE